MIQHNDKITQRRMTRKNNQQEGSIFEALLQVYVYLMNTNSGIYEHKGTMPQITREITLLINK